METGKTKGKNTVKSKLLATGLAASLAITGAVGLTGCDDGKDEQASPITQEQPADTEDAPTGGEATPANGDYDPENPGGPHVGGEEPVVAGENYESGEAEAEAIADVYRKHGYTNVVVDAPRQGRVSNHIMTGITAEYRGEFFTATIYIDDDSSEIAYSDTDNPNSTKASDVQELDRVLSYVN
jgi:hypothetical protein